MPELVSSLVSDTDINPILPCDLPLVCLAVGLSLPWRYHRKQAIFAHLRSVFTEITNNKNRTAEKHCQKSGEARETTLMAYLLVWAWACHDDNTRKRPFLHIFTQFSFKTTKIEIWRNIASRLKKQGKQLYGLKDREKRQITWPLEAFGSYLYTFWSQQAFSSYLYTSILATASIRLLLLVYK